MFRESVKHASSILAQPLARFLVTDPKKMKGTDTVEGSNSPGQSGSTPESSAGDAVSREARIANDPDFPNWMSFGKGITYCETARRMANWYYLFNKQRHLPRTLQIYVRDVGGKTQFYHEARLSLQIDVTPARSSHGKRQDED
jgi:hypothetical protein